MPRPTLKSAAALVFGMSLVAVAWDGQGGKTVELEGYVYRGRDASATPGAPVVGAVVSVSLDPSTAVTDAHGHFHLRTDVRVSGDEFYTITVQAPGMAFRQRTVGVPIRGSDFGLSTTGRIEMIYPPYLRPLRTDR